MNTRIALILVFLCAVGSVRRLVAEEGDRQPKRFGWQYNFEPEPGTRVWMRDEGKWIERYPSGTVKTLRIVARTTVDGDNGTIVQALDDTAFQVFIPDTGSKLMWLRMRRDKGKWQFLAEIKRVN